MSFWSVFIPKTRGDLDLFLYKIEITLARYPIRLSSHIWFNTNERIDPWWDVWIVLLTFLINDYNLEWDNTSLSHHLKMTWKMKIYNVCHHQFTLSHTWPFLHIIFMNFWKVIPSTYPMMDCDSKWIKENLCISIDKIPYL